MNLVSSKIQSKFNKFCYQGTKNKKRYFFRSIKKDRDHSEIITLKRYF